MAICMAVSSLSIPAFATSSPHEYGPAPEYRNMQGLPKDVKYNSEGVPILGEEILIKAPSRYKDISGKYSINGHNIPLSNYPIGSIWDGSNQCVGFARYVYNTIWNNESGTTFSKDTSSKSKAQTAIQSLKIGTRITGFNGKDQKHTMIVVDNYSDDDYVVVYHANYSTKYNKVTLTKFTYAEFYKLFDSIQGYNPPK